MAIFLSGRSKTAEDYFLAGRRFTWPLIGLSLFASNISGTTLVGLAGDAYATGISVYNYEWLAAVVLAFFAVFVMPFIIKSRVFTVPEYLERRYDRRARIYFSGLTLFLTVVIDTSATLYAGGLILHMIFPDTPIWAMIAILALVAGAYTIVGGLAAVIITDAVQAVILLVGSAVVAWSAFEHIGGWSEIIANVPAEKLSLIRPLDDPGVPWLGLIAGAPLLGFYFWCTNQFMVQRVLSAVSLEHGRWGALFAGLIKLPTLFLMVLPGTAAILLFPDLPRADLVYPTLIFKLLPAGLLGLVLAGFLAAMMSQIDSAMNSASTLVTMDFVRMWKPEITEHDLVKIGRWSTFAVLVLAILWAPQIERFGSLFKYLQIVLSYAVTPTMALFIIGSFWRRANGQGGFIALMSGTALGVAMFLMIEVFHLFSLHFLYVTPIVFGFSCLVLVAASLMTKPSEKDPTPYIWTVAGYRAETATLRERPLWMNYRLQAVLLLALSALIVGYFW
ncbi:MAG: sodium transporter [Alphaproteobacteria bacterium]|nr:MAG: sodium transporter [Alphaproteobacteria bacterium]